MTPQLSLDTAKLDALFEPFNRSDRPGLVIGVAHRHVPAYRRGFGLASVELPVALSPGMRLRIGSTTKHFCCLGLMLLAEEGKLSIDDSVRNFIPELGAWGAPVTLRALMNHTSGARCSLDLLHMTNGIMSRPLPAAEQLKLMTSLNSANFAPGADWLYSNGGYVLLTEVLRRVSGSTFEDFVVERILKPVGMHQSYSRPVDSDCAPNSATLHVPAKGGGFTKGVFGPAIAGEGAMVSTVDDMLRWLAHMDAPTVGSRASWAEMRKASRLHNGASTGYGLGLFMGQYRGVSFIGHSGHMIGGTCQMIKLPNLELDIVMMTNTSGIDAPTVTENVIDTLVEGLTPKEENVPGPFPKGTFHSRVTGRMLRLDEQDDSPALDFVTSKYPIRRREDGTAWLRSNLFEGAVVAPNGDGVDWIEWEMADHLEPVDAPDRAVISAIVGDYECQEAGLSATIRSHETDTLTFKGLHGLVQYRLEPRGQDLWEVFSDELGGGAVLEHREDELLFSSSRTKRLKFVRRGATA